MTEKTLEDLHPEDVDHARAYVQDFLDATYAPDRTLAVARVLYALLPPPPRPTLADMAPEERAECRWMQCDYGGVIRDSQSRGVIGYLDHGDKVAVILTTKCGIRQRDYASVTPRPDLPRMTWPGDTPHPSPTLPDGWRLADHPAYGRVIVTSAAPDTDGYVYFVSRATGPIGNDWHLCPPGELTYIDTEPEADQ